MPTAPYNTKVHRNTGGDTLEVESGGTVTAKAGSVVNIEAGATIGGGVLLAASFTATLAEINAGKALVAGITGKQLRVLRVTLVVNGAVQTATAVVVTNTAGTVAHVTWAVAALTDAARLDTDNVISNQTVGVGMNALLAAGQGVAIGKTGSAATNSTSVSGVVYYTIN